MKRLLAVLLVALSCVISITGCKKKQVEVAPVEQAVTYSEDEYLALQNKLTQKDNELALYDERYKSLDAFKKKSVIQAGRWTFNKVNDKIVLSGMAASPLINSGVKTTGLATVISLGDKVKVDTSGWTVQTGTSELDLSIPEKACGKISILKYVNDDFDYNRIIFDWIGPFLEENNLEMQSTKEIYQSEMKIGDEATANISILDSTANGFEVTIPATQIFEEEDLVNWQLSRDSEVKATINMDEDKKIDAELRVGLANSNGLLLYYEFINYDKSGKKLTDNVINSITIDGKEIYLK